MPLTRDELTAGWRRGPHASLWAMLGRYGGRLHVLLPPPGRRGRGAPRAVDLELSGWSAEARRTVVLRVAMDREAVAAGGLELALGLAAAFGAAAERGR